MEIVHTLILPSGREIRQTEDGVWSVQHPRDNWWEGSKDLATAMIGAGWGGEDGGRSPIYDFDGNLGELLYKNADMDISVVDWSPTGGSIELVHNDDDDLRDGDECFSCGTWLKWSRIQTRQYHANWQEAVCESCGEEARLEDRGGTWIRVKGD